LDGTEFMMAYHLMIDRFATANQDFQPVESVKPVDSLRSWMGGNFKGIIESLGYISGLGVDTIFLSPFMKSHKYHGYWVTDYFSVEEHFGTDDDLACLVSEAHIKGIRVMMDVPITHCHMSNRRFCQPSVYKSEFLLKDHRGSTIGFFGDPDLPEIDLDRAAVRQEVLDILRYWLSYGFDGIRFDHAKRPSLSFWHFLVPELKKLSPQSLLLGENWSEQGEIGRLVGLLDGELNLPLAFAMRRFLMEPGLESMSGITAIVNLQESLRERGYIIPAFIDNHDLERAAVLARGNESLLKLGYLILMTLPYPVIIYSGSERSQGQTANLPEGCVERDRFFREPTSWSIGQHFADWIGRISRLRRTLWPMLSTAHITFDADPLRSILRYSYSMGEDIVEVIANYGHAPNRVHTAYRHKCLASTHEAREVATGEEICLLGHQGVVLVNEEHGERNRLPGAREDGE